MKENLKIAIRYLIGHGVIEKDKDIAERMGYNKSTVSAYINGDQEPSTKFIQSFEQTFKLRLADFKKGGPRDTVEVPNSTRLIAETVLQLKAEIQTSRQLIIEMFAKSSGLTVSEASATAEKLLQHNLSKILHELKRE